MQFIRALLLIRIFFPNDRTLPVRCLQAKAYELHSRTPILEGDSYSAISDGAQTYVVLCADSIHVSVLSAICVVTGAFAYSRDFYLIACFFWRCHSWQGSTCHKHCHNLLQSWIRDTEWIYILRISIYHQIYDVSVWRLSFQTYLASIFLYLIFISHIFVRPSTDFLHSSNRIAAAILQSIDDWSPTRLPIAEQPPLTINLTFTCDDCFGIDDSLRSLIQNRSPCALRQQQLETSFPRLAVQRTGFRVPFQSSAMFSIGTGLSFLGTSENNNLEMFLSLVDNMFVLTPAPLINARIAEYNVHMFDSLGENFSL